MKISHILAFCSFAVACSLPAHADEIFCGVVTDRPANSSVLTGNWTIGEQMIVVDKNTIIEQQADNEPGIKSLAKVQVERSPNGTLSAKKIIFIKDGEKCSEGIVQEFKNLF